MAMVNVINESTTWLTAEINICDPNSHTQGVPFVCYYTL